MPLKFGVLPLRLLHIQYRCFHAALIRKLSSLPQESYACTSKISYKDITHSYFCRVKNYRQRDEAREVKPMKTMKAETRAQFEPMESKNDQIVM